MPTLQELIEQKLLRLETVPETLFGQVNQVQFTILQDILQDLQGLETRGGKIILSGSNLIQIDVIGNKLQTVLFEGEYIEAVKEFSRQFPKQARINKAIFDKSFSDFSDKSIFANVLKSSQKNAIDKLSRTAISEAFIKPLEEQLNLAVTGEAGIAETANSLRTFVQGGVSDGKIIDGTLERYVKQVSRDAYAVSDREYTQTISNDLGVEFFMYSGGTVKDSRCFCVERVGRVFSRQQVESWGNNPSLWNGSGSCKGGGRARGTNETTIFSFLGGYNCLHSLIPVEKPEDFENEF